MESHGVRIIALGLVLSSPLSAQVRDPEDTLSAGEGSGPISEVSRPVGEGSLAVHDGARTIGESSGSSVRSGPVRDPGTRSMLSGPVSESSQGPMTHPRALSGGGSVAEASAGAVKHDIASPLGERISQPLRELGPLQDRLRALRQQPAADVVMELPPDDLPPDELPVYDAAALDAAVQAEVAAQESEHPGAERDAESLP